MAITKKVEIDVSTVKAAGGLEAFKQQMKGVDKEVKNTSASTQQLSGTLDRMTGGAVTKFGAFRGALGTVTKGFVTLRGAIMATGIGALLVLIGSLTAAFKRSEEGQNKFSKILGVIGSVVSNLLDVFANFGEAVISAFENPKKAWQSFTSSLKSGYEFIKKQVLDRLSGTFGLLTGNIQASILKMRVAWNEFTGDDTEAKALKKELVDVQKYVDDSRKKIVNANAEVAKGFMSAVESVKEFGREVIKDAKSAAKVADQRAAADKAARDLIIERANAERDIAELREKAADKENVSTEERIKALEEAGRISEELAQKEIAVSKLRADAKTLENSLSKSTREDLDEEARLRADVINAETAKLKLQKALTAELTTARRESAAAAKGETEATKEQVDEVGKILEDFRKKEQDRAAETEVQKIELEQQRALAELERLKATEEQKQKVKDYYEIDLTRARAEEASKKAAEKLALDKENDLLSFEEQRSILAQREALLLADKTISVKDRTELEKTYSEKRKEIDKLEADSKKDQLERTENALNQLSDIAGESTVAGKGFAIASATLNTYRGVSDALAATTATPFETALKFVNAAAILTNGLRNVKKIVSVKIPNAKGGGGTGGASSPSGGAISQPPAFNVVGQGGTNQLAQAIGQQEQQPVQAYVVANDVTSAQSLQRNIQTEAGLG